MIQSLTRSLRDAALLTAWLFTMVPLMVAEAAEPRSQNGITYMTGGIGHDDLDSMRAQAGRFNIRLNLVSASSGESLSDALVIVATSAGKQVLRIVTEGPLLYLSLRPGAYLVTADYQGQEQTVRVTAGPKPLDIVIRIPVNALEEDWLYCERGCPRGGP